MTVEEARALLRSMLTGRERPKGDAAVEQAIAQKSWAKAANLPLPDSRFAQPVTRERHEAQQRRELFMSRKLTVVNAARRDEWNRPVHEVPTNPRSFTTFCVKSESGMFVLPGAWLAEEVKHTPHVMVTTPARWWTKPTPKFDLVAARAKEGAPKRKPLTSHDRRRHNAQVKVTRIGG